jgi:hypothetical protein
MVDCVLDHGLDDRGDRGAVPGRRQDGPQVARPVPRRGRGRSLDRSSRPHRSPNRDPARSVERQVLSAAPQAPLGRRPHRPSRRVVASTVQRILQRSGGGRLDRGDRATAARAGPPLPARPARRAGPCRRQEARRDPRPAAAGRPTAAARHPPARTPRSATGSSTPRSTTAPASPTPRSSTDEQGATAAGFWRRAAPGSRFTGSPSNAASPTTAPATGHGSGPQRSPRPA